VPPLLNHDLAGLLVHLDFSDDTRVGIAEGVIFASDRDSPVAA
jgi:hypothetical protein